MGGNGDFGSDSSPAILPAGVAAGPLGAPRCSACTLLSGPGAAGAEFGAAQAAVGDQLKDRKKLLRGMECTGAHGVRSTSYCGRVGSLFPSLGNDG